MKNVANSYSTRGGYNLAGKKEALSKRMGGVF